jgi:hypothetical protein
MERPQVHCLDRTLCTVRRGQFSVISRRATGLNRHIARDHLAALPMKYRICACISRTIFDKNLPSKIGVRLSTELKKSWIFREKAVII